MYEEVEDFEPDVLAVLKRSGVEITFITTPRSALSGEDFAILLWTDSAMTVGIADEYLNSEIDEFVANGIIERTPDLTEEVAEEAVKEHAVNLFSTKLLDVFNKAVENVSDASRHNFEYTLDRLLDEGRLD